MIYEVIFVIAFILWICICGIIAIVGKLRRSFQQSEREKENLKRIIKAYDDELRFYKSLVAVNGDERSHEGDI